MPHFFPFANHEDEDVLQEIEKDVPHKRPRRSSVLRSIGGLFKKPNESRNIEANAQTTPVEPSQVESQSDCRGPSAPGNAGPLKPVPSLRRPQTFQRQESERREKLLVVSPSPTERRAVSEDRRRGSSNGGRRPFSPKPVPLPSISAPEIVQQDQRPSFDNEDSKDEAKQPRDVPQLPHLHIPDEEEGEVEVNDEQEAGEIDQNSLQEEYDRRWILNLSMHFRDKSNREKFFVTYAETPTKWRRLTISLDYRNAPKGSLETDLNTLHYQRDKSFRIYEAIRESLHEIEYYNTVTNLKLQTAAEDGQLHVHVREDANENVRYPDISLFRHVRVPRYRESLVEFISHLSGFVYKVKVEGATVIKKEIPGPDAIDEFLYEVNALEALLGCKHVVELVGLVTDESNESVKGLLISYASSGALVDMIYDFRKTSELSWHRREKWAKHIIQGLAEIHEAGYVQGDFTLSNIVIDDNDNAQVIDINRRGCPVGWEPPELSKLIGSGQRISMCIGVKTDLYQLGMILWALAEEEDEPERVERPLPPVNDSIPSYFKRIIRKCLSERPQDRSSAKRLLRLFPSAVGMPPFPSRPSVEDFGDAEHRDDSIAKHRSDKEYIDPDTAVTLEDVNPRHRNRDSDSSLFATGLVTYVDPHDLESNPGSTTYRFEDCGSWDVVHRGRSSASGKRRKSSPFARSSSSSATSLSESPPSRGQRRCGSDFSGDDIDAELDSPVRDPSDRNNPTVPAIEISAAETPPHRVTFQDEGVAAVQKEGFDEQMVDELDLGPSEDTTSHTDLCSCDHDMHELCELSAGGSSAQRPQTPLVDLAIPDHPLFKPTSNPVDVISKAIPLQPQHTPPEERAEMAPSLIHEPRQITNDK